MKDFIEMLRAEFKNILNDLMEQADDIVNDMVKNNCIESKILIELGCETLPNYTISTKKLSSKVMESLNNGNKKQTS